MKNTFKSLESTLNSIVDTELTKETNQIDDCLIIECSDALLRMENYAKYILSPEKVTDNIQKILSKIKYKEKKKLSKAAKIILLAAIISIVVALSVFGYAQYKYKIIDFGTYSKIIAQIKGGKIGDEIAVGYVPDGFECVYSEKHKNYLSLEYKNGDKEFNIIEQSYSDSNAINTQFKADKKIEIDGQIYFIYGDYEHGIGIFWNNGNNVFRIHGNISENEIIKIVKSISYISQK